MASAVLVVLLGTYLVTSESSEPMVASSPDVAWTGAPSTPAMADRDSLQQQRQRDAVLVCCFVESFRFMQSKAILPMGASAVR